MTKSILMLLVLILSFAGSYQQTNIKSISINSKEHEKKHNIQITNKEKNKCEMSETLNLDEMSLNVIRDDIIKSEAIRHVTLHGNLLKKVPQNILDKVPYLSCLNLSHNNINVYKNNVIRHLSLRVLDLSYQEMIDINNISEPEVFEETEIINNGEATFIYNINKYTFNSTNMRLPNLEYLDLSGNDICCFLWDFHLSFPKLIRLDLVNVNAETMYPNFFEKIPTSLQILHLENNYLRNVTLQNLAGITALYLDRNPLENLVINSTTLRVLSLSNCTKLNVLQFEGQFTLPYLEELDLSKNNFDNAFQLDFYFPSLRVLVLDYNKFSNIPLLHNLQLSEFSVCYNRIKQIQPNTFGNFRTLVKLSLKGNKIDNLEKNTFSGLEKLEYLDLSENQLSYLPTDWAWPLKRLKYLNVNSNQFASISEMGAYSIISLKHLFVRNNTFTKISTLEIEPLADFITIYLL